MNAPTTDDPTTGAIPLKESLNKVAQSQVWSISIRGWLALMLTITVCVMSGVGVEVIEPLYSMALLALGFYFGQK